MTFSF